MANTLSNFDPSEIRNRNTRDSRPLAPRVGGLAVPRKLNDTLFSGYEDISIGLPLKELIDEDLDNVIDTSIEYYANGTNSCSHKPDEVEEFNLKVSRTGANSIVQNLTDSKTLRIYIRKYNKTNGWSEWYYTYNTLSPLPSPSNSETANKLSTARKISLTGSIKGSTVFDGSKDVEINCEDINTIGNDSIKLRLSGNQINIGGTEITNSLVIGGSSVDDNDIPTDYYFGTDGSAKIHVSDLIIEGESIKDSLAPKSHTHSKNDITDFPDSIKNPNKLTIKVGDEIIDDYDGSENVELNLKPGVISKATRNDFPNIGDKDVLYVDRDTGISYIWNPETNQYQTSGWGFDDVTILNGNLI